jgi:hypothetical protein
LAKPIRIIVKGSENLGEDAPTVEDLLSQIQDLVYVLHGVEGALAEDGKEEIVWRVTDVTRNSPLAFEITPFPKLHAMNIDRRADKVVTATANGFHQLATTEERPTYFNDKVVERAEKVFARVTNGLASTLIDFAGYSNAPMMEVSTATARQSIERIKSFRAPAPIPHRELGSLEGYITRVELDGHSRPVVWLRSRLDGQIVKCVAADNALDRIGHYEVGEVLNGLRIAVFGVLNYKDLDQIATINVEGVHAFAPDNELPDHDKIVSSNFTKGLEASEYLEMLRQDG